MAFTENVDYELVPQEGETWGARILKGEFTETVVKIGTVKFLQDGMINFNFDILESPDKALNTDDSDLQKTVGDVLFSIIRNELERKNERTGKDNPKKSSD